MKMKLLGFVACVVLSVPFAGSASAATVNLFATGHVTSSTGGPICNCDNTGVFLPPSGGSLNSLPFTAEVTWDTTSAGLNVAPGNPNFAEYSGSNNSWMNISVTINNHTISIGNSAFLDDMRVTLGVTQDTFEIQTENHSATVNDAIQFVLRSTPGTYFFSNNSVPTSFNPNDIWLVGSTGNLAIFDPALGNATAFLQFDSFSNSSQTPLPAALPLFASGLGALGLLGWRRKRKAAAIAT